MKRFHDLLAVETHNQYGLKYTQINDSVRRSQNLQKNDKQHVSQTVEIYAKFSNKKSAKIKVQKECQIKNLKEILSLKGGIAPQNQILYLNGRQITDYFSITFKQLQILHVSNKNTIVNQNQNILLNLQIFVPSNNAEKGLKFSIQFLGGNKINVLQKQVSQRVSISNPENSFTINFLESGRLLDKNKTFTENHLTKQCSIICLYSQNDIQTKFQNQFCQFPPQKSKEQKNYEAFQIHQEQFIEPSSRPQIKSSPFSFKKSPVNQKNFLTQKLKTNFYQRIDRKSQSARHLNDALKPIMKRRQSEATLQQLSLSGFKKKRNQTDDQKTEDSQLIKAFVVRKSKKQLEKILSDNSLLNKNINEQEEKQSFVSSSQSQERVKQYIPVRRQKQYRPCPLIPQRKMPQSQKIKINFELQKLFGIQPKINQRFDEESQNKNLQNEDENKQETKISRNTLKGGNLRNSISAQESIMKALKDRKSNRYAEQKMYDGD